MLICISFCTYSMGALSLWCKLWCISFSTVTNCYYTGRMRELIQLPCTYLRIQCFCTISVKHLAHCKSVLYLYLGTWLFTQIISQTLIYAFCSSDHSGSCSGVHSGSSVAQLSFRSLWPQ